MGQRIQIIIRMPNSGTNEEKVVVFHNQWLYGMNFIKYQVRLIKAIKHFLEGDNIVWDDLLDDAIKHSNYADLDYLTYSRYYDEDNDGQNYNKELLSASDSKQFVEMWDNNNGFMYIYIDSDNKVSYGILNGYEDGEQLLDRTPMQYLKLFYRKGEEKEDKKVLAAVEYLKTIPSVNVLENLQELKDLVLLNKMG